MSEYGKLTPGIKDELRKIVGDKYYHESPEEHVAYAYDASAYRFKPDLILRPRTTDHVRRILKVASRERIPVVPRGAGTGLTGGSIPLKGGIVLAFTAMDLILKIEPENLIAVIQPGIVTADFHRAVSKYGLFYPPDPASLETCTLGGNVAECAGGPHCLKYGVTRDYVLGLVAVLPDGTVFKTGTDVIKNVVGYDLTRLLIGSEGTLAVITEITVRLIPLPKSTRTILAYFDKSHTASKGVSKIIAEGILPSTLEFMDETSIRAVEKFAGLGIPPEVEGILLVEVDGDPGGVIKSADEIIKILNEIGSLKIEQAEDEKMREKLWHGRRSIAPALGQAAQFKLDEDVVLPVSLVPEGVAKIKEISKKHGIPVAIYGHAGDGNLHVNLLLAGMEKEHMDGASEMLKEIYEYICQKNGAISGEHGIGFLKAPYISMGLDPTALDLMKKIKKIFDPGEILNPGKIFP
ncbi:MAG: FAD-binding protein [Candidatus Eremiobacteraeota bacterium]|nr:FAD-binding protein [Candidatus Eremiobacteraeota bacterium]